MIPSISPGSWRHLDFPPPLRRPGTHDHLAVRSPQLPANAASTRQLNINLDKSGLSQAWVGLGLTFLALLTESQPDSRYYFKFAHTVPPHDSVPGSFALNWIWDNPPLAPYFSSIGPHPASLLFSESRTLASSTPPTSRTAGSYPARIDFLMVRRDLRHLGLNQLRAAGSGRRIPQAWAVTWVKARHHLPCGGRWI